MDTFRMLAPPPLHRGALILPRPCGVQQAAPRVARRCSRRALRARALAQPASSAAAAAAAPAAAPPSYQWSWDGSGGAPPPEQSPFDDTHPIPDALGAAELATLLRAAAAAAATAAPPSAPWMRRLCGAADARFAPGAAAGALSSDDAFDLLQAFEAAGLCPPAAWQARLLQPLAAAAAGGALPPAALAGALWSLSNLSSGADFGPGGGGGAGAADEAAAAAAAAQLLSAAAKRLPDFFGPDLARLVCAAGTLAAAAAAPADAGGGGGADADAGGAAAAGALSPSPPRAPPVQQQPQQQPHAALGVDATWVAAVLKECEYQVVEFPADLGAFDLARLALGISLLTDLGDLGAAGGAPWPEASGRLREALLKAVYARTRTIEEKGAVDYALARLDAKGKRSMHYDPRWTHEELNWLPRRERDKRRILKDGWYRTQWSGWRA
ncbi:MAG: hypothetical protein J3K34DRAFT_524039 [Monoraphidium minutum]|nr:MAG: hypothetical protein J3K34DRAFT_524039 [Monoraphidium minutum]